MDLGQLAISNSTWYWTTVIFLHFVYFSTLLIVEIDLAFLTLLCFCESMKKWKRPICVYINKRNNSFHSALLLDKIILLPLLHLSGNSLMHCYVYFYFLGTTRAGSCAIDFTQLGHRKCFSTKQKKLKVKWNFSFYLVPKQFRCPSLV